jgi:heme-degrading monooxygenase HmoA
MIAVIFEVYPKDGCKDEYLDIASQLKPHLSDIDGFISVERFQSLTDSKKLLSLSFWRDEDALKHWRQLEPHRQAQSKGRNELFDDYRLRIAGVIRDYGMLERQEAPHDSQSFHH